VAENLGVKNYKWDKKDGYKVPDEKVRNLYNSYFYPSEAAIDPVKKFFYQGHGFADICSGGVALHNNLAHHLTKDQYRKLMDVAVKAGCNYFTYNIKNTVCKDCGYISKDTLDECPHCHSHNLLYASRVIGYLKLISSFSDERQIEAGRRYYGDLSDEIKVSEESLK
jgi:anaerobic ribonucleoside-triphosphate reductase